MSSLITTAQIPSTIIARSATTVATVRMFRASAFCTAQIVSRPLSIGHTDTRQIMYSHVLALGHNLQILLSIVASVIVSMMYYLRSQQQSSHYPLCDKAMFGNVSVSIRLRMIGMVQEDIAIGDELGSSSSRLSAQSIVSALRRAIFTTLANFARETREFATTCRAIQYDSCMIRAHSGTSIQVATCRASGRSQRSRGVPCRFEYTTNRWKVMEQMDVAICTWNLEAGLPEGAPNGYGDKIARIANIILGIR